MKRSGCSCKLEDDNNDEYRFRPSGDRALDAMAVRHRCRHEVNFGNTKTGCFVIFLARRRSLFNPTCCAMLKSSLDYAVSPGAEAIATGHYACRWTARRGAGELHKGADPNKDQSYFFVPAATAPAAPGAVPLGELQQASGRCAEGIASQIQLPNARKKDSTGICFIGERLFRELLCSAGLPTQPGVR